MTTALHRSLPARQYPCGNCDGPLLVWRRVLEVPVPDKLQKPKISPKPLRPRNSSNAHKHAKPATRLEEVLQSAANIFFAKGFHATSIEDVARDVGMLKGSLRIGEVGYRFLEGFRFACHEPTLAKTAS